MSENSKTNETADVQIKEFVSHSEVKKNLKKKASQATKAYAKKTANVQFQDIVQNKSFMSLVLYAIAAIVVILISAFVYKVPIVSVCFVVIIETLLAVCLHNLPIWLHVIIVVAEIILGIICSKVVFMILGAVLYIAAILVLQIVMKEK